jgi:hypothetical protein
MAACYSPDMNRQDPPKAVRVDGWTVDGSWPGRRSGVSTVGIFLVVLGVFLAAGQLFSEAQTMASGFFLAVGLILLFVGIRDRSDLALYAGAFVTAFALSDLLRSLGVIHGSGWSTLFLGVAVMAIALIRSSTGKRLTWTLGIGGLLTLWGGSDVLASNFSNLLTDRLIGPLLIVLLGLYVVTRSRR